jgi:glutamine amidotransferase
LAHGTLPQVGWNEVRRTAWGTGDALLEGLPDEFHAYYVNTYAPKPKARNVVLAQSTYGRPFVAGVRRLNTYGVQFHPEKSSAPGLRLVSNFVGIAEGWS